MKNIDQIAILSALALAVLSLSGGVAQAQGASQTPSPVQDAAPAAADTTPMALPTPRAPDAVQLAPTTLTNGPIPDTAENRAKFGSPLSHAGKKTPPKGN